VWFDGVIEVDETVQLQLSVEVILEFGFHMPHLHQGADDPFGLAIGLRAVDLGELLADAVGFTVSNSFEKFPIISVKERRKVSRIRLYLAIPSD